MWKYIPADQRKAAFVISHICWCRWKIQLWILNQCLMFCFLISQEATLKKYAFLIFFWQALKIFSLETSDKPQMRQWKQSNINVLTDFDRKKHFFFN